MRDVTWIIDLLLFFVGLACFVGFPKLRKKGHLYLEEELGWVVWAVTGLAFYYVNAEGGHLFPAGLTYEFPALARIAQQLLIDVGFLVAFVLQLRANVKKSDSGPTHPKEEPYEGGGQAYPWDEE